LLLFVFAYIEHVLNRNSTPAMLLREFYRESTGRTLSRRWVRTGRSVAAPLAASVST
jgi:hypothetical protein